MLSLIFPSLCLKRKDHEGGNSFSNILFHFSSTTKHNSYSLLACFFCCKSGLSIPLICPSVSGGPFVSYGDTISEIDKHTQRIRAQGVQVLDRRMEMTRVLNG